MTSTELLELMGKCPVGELCDTYTTGFNYANVEDLLDSKTMVTVIGYDNPASNIALARLIAKLVNHAALFAELLAEREVGKWSKPIGTGAWLELHRGTEFLGIIYHRKSEGDFYWNALGRGNHCATEAEARAAVEAAIRGAK